MTEKPAAPLNIGLDADLLLHELQGLLEMGNYDAVKPLLSPLQEVDIAEVIGGLPRTLQALAFRLLSKDEAIEVYEYLEPPVQQSLLELLRSGEVLELVEEMSPDDRVRSLSRASMCLCRCHFFFGDYFQNFLGSIWGQIGVSGGYL